MSKILLNASVRKEIGKYGCKSLRKEGKIPAVVYGSGDKPFCVSVNEREFGNTFSSISENLIFSLKVENKTYDVLIKNYSHSILKNRVSHIDFLIIHSGHEIRTNVPIKFTGKAYGEVEENGIVEKTLLELKVSCLPKDLPSEIIIDITNLKVGESLHVSKITGYDNVKFLNSPEEVIVQIFGQSSMSEVESTQEAVAEPEVVTAKAKEQPKEE